MVSFRLTALLAAVAPFVSSAPLNEGENKAIAVRQAPSATGPLYTVVYTSWATSYSFNSPRPTDQVTRREWRTTAIITVIAPLPPSATPGQVVVGTSISSGTTTFLATTYRGATSTSVGTATSSRPITWSVAGTAGPEAVTTETRPTPPPTFTGIWRQTGYRTTSYRNDPSGRVRDESTTTSATTVFEPIQSGWPATIVRTGVTAVDQTSRTLYTASPASTTTAASTVTVVTTLAEITSA